MAITRDAVLIHSSHCGDTKKLVERLLSINPPTDSDKGAALCSASTTEVAELLLMHGASVDHQEGDFYHSCLHQTTTMWYKERKAMMELLIRQKADVNLRSRSEKTPLLMAAERHDQEMVELLLQSKADVNAELNAGPVLNVAMQKLCLVPIITQLIEHKADLTKGDVWGQTPLLLSVRLYNMTMVKLILKKDNINQQDKQGRTALHHAVIRPHAEAVNFLLKNDADCTITDTNGKTALDLAKQQDDKIYAELIEKHLQEKEAQALKILERAESKTGAPRS